MVKWSEPKEPKGGQYPNYWTHKSPSGHVISMDDSEGEEKLIIQHRSGSKISMLPDGEMVFRSHKGKYEVIFGDNKMLVTGDMDVTVNGGCSLKVEGDMDTTVSGNMHTVVSGNMETLVHGNVNMAVNGNVDSAVDGNKTEKIAGNSEHTAEGKAYLGGHDGIAIESTGGNAELRADSKVITKAGTNTEMTSLNDMTIDTTGTMTSTSGETTFINGEFIKLNSS